jgi:hypothetical protein
MMAFIFFGNIINFNNILLAKQQEVICPKRASFSAIAASVAFWALLKVRSKQKDRL